MAEVTDYIPGASSVSTEGNTSSSYSEFNAEALQSMLAAYLANQNGYLGAGYTDVNNAGVMDLPTLQQALGTNITYDRQAIEDLYNTATETGYGIERKNGAENAYFKALASSSSEANKVMADQYNRAAAQGASAGMAAANQLSSILGMGQQAQEQAQQLAIDRQNSMKEYAQQMAQNKVDALKYSNDTQTNLAQQARQLYNDSIQQQTAQLAYNQAANTDIAGYNANKDTVLGNLLGNLGSAGSNAFANSVTSLASIQNAIAAADAQKNQQITYAGDYTVRNGKAK